LNIERRWDDEINGGSDTLMLKFGIGVKRLEAEHFFAAFDRVKEINSRLSPNRTTTVRHSDLE